MAPEGEGRAVDLKVSFDPDNPKAMMELAKDVVALANSGGGIIKIGYTETTSPGVDLGLIKALDGANVGNKVSKYVAPSMVSVSHSVETLGDGKVGIMLQVDPANKYPLVFCQDGQVQAPGNGPSHLVFRKGDIYLRHGAKSERATYQDLIAFIDAAFESVTNNILGKMSDFIKTVVHLPPDFQVKFVPPTGEELDDPNSLLSTMVARGRQQPGVLLHPRDVLWCLMASDALVLDDAKLDLLIRSAFRRTATLFFWLTRARNQDELVGQVILTTLDDPDRDKSDAAHALIEVGAHVLPDNDLQALIEGLKQSRYSHFRQASAKWKGRAAELDSYWVRVRAASFDGRHLLDISEAELGSLGTRVAERMLQGDHSPATPRLLGDIGRVLYSRTLTK